MFPLKNGMRVFLINLYGGIPDFSIKGTIDTTLQNEQISLTLVKLDSGGEFFALPTQIFPEFSKEK